MSDDSGLSGADLDCAICLQKCHHPTQLPCGHIFCFLCVKGVALQTRTCAMCRAQIPVDYLDAPVLLERLRPDLQPNCTDEIGDEIGYQWYYEGRNGWWKYEERSNSELESAFNNGATECSLLLAGAIYIVDFQLMVQFRHSDPTRRRKVRRDTPKLPAKGIAGIKDLNYIETNHQSESENISDASSNGSDDDVIYVGENEEIIINLDDVEDSSAGNDDVEDSSARNDDEVAAVGENEEFDSTHSDAVDEINISSVTSRISLMNVHNTEDSNDLGTESENQT